MTSLHFRGARNSSATSLVSQKRRVMIVCAHLRPGRVKRRSSYVMQPISGLHVASLIDAERYDVSLWHEDWHGPYDTTSTKTYDIVFLSGLQPDFDRMRQLSFHFRRGGSVVVAGGSICTIFPEFATRFFDVVCAGGIDSARHVMEDFERGTLKPIYRSPIKAISSYDVDYSNLTRNGINPSVHLLESSRGCSFKCKFCVVPSEVGDHAAYDLAAVQRALDNAITTSPRSASGACIRSYVPGQQFLGRSRIHAEGLRDVARGQGFAVGRRS